MFKWLRERDRAKILKQPYPEHFDGIIKRNVAHAGHLSPEERARLRQMIQVFVGEKNFVGCGGLEMDDTIRVTVAANACLLILELDHDLYRRTETINVYPASIQPPQRAAESGVVADANPVLGLAFYRGPVVLSWKSVVQGSRNAQSGHNVAIHEFAHKLDMLDDEVDGTPPLDGRDAYQVWDEVCGHAYADNKKRIRAGRKTVLGAYATTNMAEFFAVATEVFFERPRALAKAYKRLYWVLSEFYQQDPAARMPGKGPRNARKRRKRRK